MLPYCINTEQSPVVLYKLKDGRYQLTEQGEIGPFMFGYLYLLVESELAEYLELLGVDRITIKDAIIWDRKNDKEHYTHKEVCIDQFFSSDQINDIDLDGDRLLTMDNHYVFASPELKKKLENSKFSYLKYSEGLSDFA